jgi:uncharacterized protein
MEEILASIRRIIEDNDAGRQQPGDLHPSNADEEASDRNIIEVDAFRSEQRAPSDEMPTSPSQLETHIPFPDNEDHSSSVANDESGTTAPSSSASLPGRDREKGFSLDRSAAEERIRMAINNARIRSEEMKRDDDAARSSGDVGGISAQASADRAVEPSQEVEPTREAEIGRETSSVAVPSLAASTGVENTPPKPAMLSEQAERKIAASFGELSEAFAARSQKTFDDMAQEMLQPMLREWLDNNLPVLVERLVREEIERVARGSQ